MLSKVYEKLAKAFEKYQLPYMVIGGQAAILFREPRFTNDIDITLGIGPGGLDNILKICKEYEFRILVENPDEFVEQTFVLPVYDENCFMRIDFIFSLSDFERDAISRAGQVDINGVKINFCSLEDIIIMKVFSGRVRDIEDVQSIIKKNPNYDRVMIENYLASLSETIDVDLVARWKKIFLS